MNIAIIGAGNVGRALATSALRAGHSVTVSSSSGDSAATVARETGATAAASNREAVEGADLVEHIDDGHVGHGDDDEAKAVVLDLVKGMGFNPIDAGQLTMARALEALAFLNISLQLRHGWSWQSGWKLVGPEGDAS